MSIDLPYEFPHTNYSLQNLTKLLSQAARTELYACNLYSTLLHYTSLKNVPDLYKVADEAYSQDRGHYHLLTARLSCLIDQKPNLEQSHENHTGIFQSPKLDANGLLVALKIAEQSAIDQYTEICAITLENDYTTFDLAYSILNNNTQHMDFLTELSIDDLYRYG